VLLVPHARSDALPGELSSVVELERHRHLQPKLELFGPLGVVGVEVVRGSLDLDDTSPDVAGEGVRSRPVLGRIFFFDRKPLLGLEASANDLALHHDCVGYGFRDLVGVDLEQVAVQNDQVRNLARLDRAELVVSSELVCAVQRVPL